MPARPFVNQGLYLQRETTPGTAATTAMKRYLGLRATSMGWDISRETFTPSGSKVAAGEITNTEMGRMAVKASQDYNALLPLLAGTLGAPTTTPDGVAVGVHSHVFNVDAFDAEELAAFTAIFGDSTHALQATNTVFHGMSFGVTRTGLSLSTTALLRAPSTGAAVPTGVNEVQTVTITGGPTAGTFTLTFDGQTTAAIAYNATAAAVRTALEALSNIGAGNVATGGGPLPGTAVTVTFQGSLTGRNVAQMTATSSLTGGTTPAVTVTTTTPGVAIDTIPMVPARASTYDVYIDDTWATLGTSKLLGLYSTNLNFGDKYSPEWVVNSALDSFADLIENSDVSMTQDLEVRFDATSVAMIEAARAGGMKFIRVEATGPEIADTGIFHKITIDTCVGLNPGEIAQSRVAPTVSANLSGPLLVDGVSGNVARVTLVNGLASL